MPKWVDFLVKPTKYSNYDLSTTKRGSCTPGILYPVWYGIMNPGEIFRMNVRSLIRTNPVKSPLMGRFKVRLVTVVSNFKNYAVGLEGYRRSFDWRTFTLPHFIFGMNKDTSDQLYSPDLAVRETSLMDYLGYQVGYLPNIANYPDAETTTLNGNGEQEDVDIAIIRKNAIPFLVYYDFYRNYLVNPQDTYYPRFRANVDSEGTRTTHVRMEPIANLDEAFESIHKYYDGTNSGPINWISAWLGVDWGYNAGGQNAPDSNGVLFNDQFVTDDSEPNNNRGLHYNDCAALHGSLVGTMFDPDINTQWLSTNNYARLQAVRVNSQGSSAAEGGVYTNFEDIVKASSLWDFISREVYSGGTYADHIYSQFGVSVKADMNIPQIVHVFDSIVDFEDITSQSETEGAVVGEQFGVGRGYGQSSRFTIRNLDNNYAYAMAFMWITPMVDYATGIPDDSNITTFSDLYTPAFDNYSMQPRLLENIDATPSLDIDDQLEYDERPFDKVIGYQPAYSEYKTATNRVHGLFANQLSYWALVRRIPTLIGNLISEYTVLPTYVYQSPIGASMEEADAMQYNIPFSVENEDNFFYQLRFDIVASRPMSKSVIPHVK